MTSNITIIIAQHSSMRYMLSVRGLDGGRITNLSAGSLLLQHGSLRRTRDQQRLRKRRNHLFVLAQHTEQKRAGSVFTAVLDGNSTRLDM